MADTKWTEAQTEAILAETGHILVSAAAGSGKTAVLVERIIRMLTREQDPLDLDRLLVMTFTRAAAGQMRTKIYRALKEAIGKQPENVHLRRQLMKVRNARICTIDALCAAIVRDHFQNIDLDPGFRIADDAEIRMIKKDTLQEVLEEAYEEGTEDFLRFAEYYMDKNDRKLEEIILTLYDYAESHPEPQAWLRAAAWPYIQAQVQYSEEEECPHPAGMGSWMQTFARIVTDQLEEVMQLAQAGEKIAGMNYGPAAYEELFLDIQEFIQSLQGQTFDYRRDAIRDYLDHWKKAPAIRTKNAEVDEELKTQAADIRKDIKKILENLMDHFLYDDLEGIFRDMGSCAHIARLIASLTDRFHQAFRNKKAERNIVDFSDIAHYALQILIQYDDQGQILLDEQGRPVYTETADQMAQSLDEIIVDEYQDTNMLQEYLINALSGARFGKPDVFMVGDVKQSIYGFRMACPELFQSKMDSYQNQEEEGRLIILDRNFRSRKEVLDFTNQIFRQSMIRPVGGIDYRSGHDLVYGGIYGEQEETDPDFTPQILLIEGSGEQAKYLEGYQIAEKIEELTGRGRYQLSDIVILTRTSDNPQLERVLYERGIPVIKNSGKGFFDSFEIRLTLDLLKIIDNPYQDIPFAAVLFSPLLGADANDLAGIRLTGQKGQSLYECLKNYQETDRFRPFLERLEQYRQKSAYMGICDFLEYILEDSSLRLVTASMPQGQDRLGNLNFLKSLARSFAKGSYTGLFHFIRYVQELRDSDMDFGSVTAAASQAQAVRMMTVHRSKGLEFPVVFLACCGKRFNETDLNASIIPDRNLGIGLELRDPDSRMIRKTVLMETIREKQKISTFAEEQRLLYVALTRAREQLIITGTDFQLSSKIKKWERETADPDKVLESMKIMHANSFLSLLGLTLHPFREVSRKFVLDYKIETDLEEERAEEVFRLSDLREKLLAAAARSEETGRIAEKLNYHYPYPKAAHIQGKISVSQLERTDTSGYGNQNRQKDGAFLGAKRGTAYHTCFELLDFQEDPAVQIARWEQEGRLEPGVVDPEKIREFLKSSLGRRMARAQQEHRLYREKQFVMGYIRDIHKEETLTGSRYESDLPDEELLLVQGIVDCWFVSEDENGSPSIVLADYKTDQNTEEEHFIHAYTPQLEAYADALERATGLKVTEKIIYSVHLNREIRI